MMDEGRWNKMCSTDWQKWVDLYGKQPMVTRYPMAIGARGHRLGGISMDYQTINPSSRAADWDRLAYSRPSSHHGQRLIRDRRCKPSKIRWSSHALERAAERALWTPNQCTEWFHRTIYLGRWARNENWGDEYWVASGIRDKKGRGLFTILTLMPRAYWNYDVIQYDKNWERT